MNRIKYCSRSFAEAVKTNIQNENRSVVCCSCYSTNKYKLRVFPIHRYMSACDRHDSPMFHVQTKEPGSIKLLPVL